MFFFLIKYLSDSPYLIYDFNNKELQNQILQLLATTFNVNFLGQNFPLSFDIFFFVFTVTLAFTVKTLAFFKYI